MCSKTQVEGYGSRAVATSVVGFALGGGCMWRVVGCVECGGDVDTVEMEVLR
jgi:hypothetical protein